MMITEDEHGNVERVILDLNKVKDREKIQEAINNPRFVKVSIARMSGKDRNNPCPCGSGKKFKKCCGLKLCGKDIG